MEAKDEIKCCICDDYATISHQSVMGQIFYPVCTFHYRNTTPAMGWDDNIKGNRMGLMDKDHEWMNIKNPTCSHSISAKL